ncbi:thiamine biosynthetic bifunctional enzyme [Stagonosporopsis vannaccii]|nr:thiamine biosynthetic bifunctional enzyme [Stagonosporopsis vannaccii]
MREYSSAEACCTCATLLSSIPPTYDEKTEKPSQYERRLDCCGRAICTRCLTDNPRFAGYCPFCQISTGPSSLPAQGLRDPPTYSPHASEKVEDELPPYSAHNSLHPPLEKVAGADVAPDVLHFVDQSNDSIPSLSLAYGVPPEVLRRTNKMFADHLLAARRTILIPGEFYKGGVSLSPRPLEGEEEEIKKTKVRKFMVGCKVAEYDVAVLYLEQANYNLENAMLAFKADEKWEREHPLQAAKKGKATALQNSGKRRWFGGSGGGITGQL